MQNVKQMKSELDNILKELGNPTDFLTFDQAKADRLNNGVKLFYDFMKKTEDPSDNNSDSLPELIINGVDQEQIYQQLQLHESSNFSSMVKFFSKCLANPETISLNLKIEKRDKKNDERKKKLEKRREKLREEESTDEEEVSRKGVNGKHDADGNDDDDGAVVEGKLVDNSQKANGKKNDTVFGIPDGSDSEISDFEVDETNQDDDDDDEDDLEGGEDEDDDEFGGLGDEDDEDEAGDDDDDDEDDEDLPKSLKKNKAKTGVKNVDDLDSDEIDEDLEDMYGNLGDEKDILEIGKPAKEFNEKEFDEQLNERFVKTPNKGNEKKKVAFKDLFENNDNDDQDDVDENGVKKSSFEKRQEKFKEKVDQIHDAMIDNLENKPWQLKGEATAKSRPQDSLLEEFLQFDHTTRQAPAITNELNLKLEDIIKQRIKDKAFDDVERKLKPVEMNYEYKKQVTLDQEKSKQSLSQVYEQEYLNKTAELANNGVASGATEEVKANPKHDEIRKGLESLFIKLDSLSNFHYTPKAPKPELKVVSNMPTIAIEEVAPVNVSDANLLAPEEIHKKIDALPMSKDEEGKKDKSRKLRQKKLVAKKNKVKKEKALKIKQAANPDDAKLNKEVALEKLKKQSKNMSNNLKVLKKDKNTKVDPSLKSSSAFFKELNDTTINNKSKGKKNKKSDKEEQKSSKRLKL